ncbi:hypothetical protein RHGRI_000145 [Rhododendron griersonianum]|uniref:Myb/SANT-like domain-containing protein n=1 Tax=Rhododendron griersonianum TaxID=479676 RepID=A0AAV6LHL3_9ERIC|nr:hypothetical protein RHGRI_000145 [Rhododendron griersonianum]
MPPLHGPQGYAFAELVLAFQENLAPAQNTPASGTMTALVTISLAASGMVGATKAFRMWPILKMIACAEEIEENGRAVNGFGKQAWARIVNAILGKTGRHFLKKQLKDKHDRLKDEWRAWILVAEDKRQTGLGRNPETGAITGPDHWWDAMIARNSHVAKFRDRGLEHEGLMGRVFRDITAMGNEAIFPGEGIEEIGEGSGDSEGMHVEGGSVPQSQEQYQTSVSKGKRPIGQTSTVGGSKSSCKRKFTDVHEAMSATFAESIDRFKSTPSIVINRSGAWGIENAIRKLDTLPMFAIPRQNKAFHSWACRFFERQQHKIDIFCEQKDMDDAIQWLRDEHSLAEERYYTPPPGCQRRGLQPPHSLMFQTMLMFRRLVVMSVQTKLLFHLFTCRVVRSA